MLKPVLLVDDDRRDLELTLITLERSRLLNPVVVVRDGAMALDYLDGEGSHAGRAGGNPAVILLDLKLPKVNGLEVLTHVRSSERLHSVPVVVLTSSNEESDVRKCHELGISAYVMKPVGLKEFMAVIANLDVLWTVAQRDCPMPGVDASPA